MHPIHSETRWKMDAPLKIPVRPPAGGRLSRTTPLYAIKSVVPNGGNDRRVLSSCVRGVRGVVDHTYCTRISQFDSLADEDLGADAWSSLRHYLWGQTAPGGILPSSS